MLTAICRYDAISAAHTSGKGNTYFRGWSDTRYPRCIILAAVPNGSSYFFIFWFRRTVGHGLGDHTGGKTLRGWHVLTRKIWVCRLMQVGQSVLLSAAMTWTAQYHEKLLTRRLYCRLGPVSCLFWERYCDCSSRLVGTILGPKLYGRQPVLGRIKYFKILIIRELWVPTVLFGMILFVQELGGGVMFFDATLFSTYSFVLTAHPFFIAFRYIQHHERFCNVVWGTSERNMGYYRILPQPDWSVGTLWRGPTGP